LCLNLICVNYDVFCQHLLINTRPTTLQVREGQSLYRTLPSFVIPPPSSIVFHIITTRWVISYNCYLLKLTLTLYKMMMKKMI
jgi:hypothetical protein